VVSLLFWKFGDGHLGKVDLGLLDAVVLGLLLPVVAVSGDLFEALLKRASGVKDSGSIIPGMGGVLDVMDSLLFGAPVFYAYTVLFLI
jgi:phosphatidate cytidylyltransferase